MDVGERQSRRLVGGGRRGDAGRPRAAHCRRARRAVDRRGVVGDLCRAGARCRRRVPAHQPRQQPPSLFAVAAGDRADGLADAGAAAGDRCRHLVRAARRADRRAAFAPGRNRCGDPVRGVADDGQFRVRSARLFADAARGAGVPVARRAKRSRAAKSAATPWWLALVAVLGMLSHMTMAAPVGLIALWVYLERRAALGPARRCATAAR